jgi:ribonuclease Z
MSKPKKLVLSHILFWGNSKESIVEEVKSNFDGEVIIAEDLMVID